MVQDVRELSPEQRAAAEMLLGRALGERESLSVQAFQVEPVSEERRHEVAARLKELFAKIDERLTPIAEDARDAEEVFAEAMRTSRPAYRSRR